MMHANQKIKKEKILNLRRLQKMLSIFVFMYLVVGIATVKVGEIFPVFSWSLFSQIPSKNQRQFDIFIHGNNEKSINPPIQFNQAPDFTVKNQKNTAAVNLIQQLGIAYTTNNEEEFIQLQTLFEKNYLMDKVKYELISETYHPIKKLKTGESTVKHLKFFLVTYHND